MDRQQNYINLVRNANARVWEGINELIALQREYNALDYGNTLLDGTGDNAGITRSEVGAVVFDTANALVALLATGHATNMAKLL
jgi:hypothetical protein